MNTRLDSLTASTLEIISLNPKPVLKNLNRLFFTLALAVLFGCSTTKSLQNGDTFYKGSQIHISKSDSLAEWKIENSSEKFSTLYLDLWDAPNGGIFGTTFGVFLPTRLYIYNWFYNTNPDGFNNWVRINFGEAPTTIQQITPDLKVDKVIDEGVKRILQDRLKEFNGKHKEAFSNLDDNPIWLNKEKGIKIKRATITGVRNAEALHEARDHFGRLIKDVQGNEVPTDYVELGNNHHIAIYEGPKGELEEDAVSFYQAVVRKNNENEIISSNNDKGWPIKFTMKQNEIFVFPDDEFDPSEIDLKDPSQKELIGKHLFRVQSISSRYYIFRHHLETIVANGDTFKNQKMLRGKTFQFIRTEKYLKGIIKVRLNHLGNIVHVGEY